MPSPGALGSRALLVGLWPRSAGFASGDPAFEDVDAISWLRPVTGHGAGLETLDDGSRVAADIVMGPQVEREAHRLAIRAAEQCLDVAGEGGRGGGGGGRSWGA